MIERTEHISDEQWKRTPKYTQSYIEFLERKLKETLSDPRLTESMYKYGDDNPPIVTYNRWGAGYDEEVLDERCSVRFRLDMLRPSDHIDCRYNINTFLNTPVLDVWTSGTVLEVIPCSSNRIYVKSGVRIPLGPQH